MTAIQSLIYGVIFGLTQIFPVSNQATNELIHFYLEWNVPNPTMTWYYTMASLFALFFVFRHDWASLLSSFIRFLMSFRKPQTLDEYLPLILILIGLPAFLTEKFIHFPITELPLWIHGCLIGLGSFLLWLSDRRSKKVKKFYDWTPLDALLICILQAVAILPFEARILGILIAAFLRNYSRQAAIKLALLSTLPSLIIKASSIDTHLKLSELPWIEGETTWILVGLGCAACFTASLLAIQSFLSMTENESFGKILFFR
ncbi:MAG: hypothetical protein CL678_16985, partial [Bdellovibrionaceae bacterium]|nr:hypothetical protein [Pseudobdellovibrionaceae bacterium]